MNSYIQSPFGNFYCKKIAILLVFAGFFAIGITLSLRPAQAFVATDTEFYDEVFPFPVSHQNVLFCHGNTSDGPIGCY